MSSQQRPEAAGPPPEQRAEAARQPPGKVIGFYSDKADQKYCEFSNFYSRAPPFQFALPEFARAWGFPEVVTCEFAEKAIMLTKAALMGDLESFQKIAAASDPATAKALGRRVHPFDEEKWGKHLEEVAFEVVRQKFAANRQLREVLLSTGTATLAEATRNDCIWGIGLDVGEDGVNDPRQWRGRNVLGFALMRAREHLRREDGAPAASSGVDARSVGPDSRGAHVGCLAAAEAALQLDSGGADGAGLAAAEVGLRADAPGAVADGACAAAGSELAGACADAGVPIAEAGGSGSARRRWKKKPQGAGGP